MTTTSRDTAEDRRRLWFKRGATVVGCWVLLWVFTSWLQLHPRPLGLLAALGALFAVCWFAADRRTDWDPVEWEGDPIGRRLQTGQDSRISYLRRLLDDAAVRRSGEEINTSAASLQGILRDLTLDRLRRRAEASGTTQVPHDSELLETCDPRLAAYLRASPAPPTDRQTVTDIINHIEAL